MESIGVFFVGFPLGLSDYPTIRMIMDDLIGIIPGFSQKRMIMDYLIGIIPAFSLSHWDNPRISPTKVPHFFMENDG